MDLRDGQPIDDEGARAFVTSWTAAWNGHDLERIMAMVADDVVFISPFFPDDFPHDHGTVTGKEGVRAWFEGNLAAVADFTIDPVHVFAGIDTVVLVEQIMGTLAANVFTLDGDGLIARSLVHRPVAGL